MDKLIQEDAGGALLSCDFIEQELEEGQIRGSFSMESMYGKAIKGKVIVTDPRVKCQESVFQGESVEISYYFDLSSFSEIGTSAQVIRTSGSLENGEKWKELAPIETLENGLEVNLKGNSVTTFVIENIVE